ncbi:hypothetical protein KRZ98_18375 [Sphingobium sp. AS12]|uniref:hypothetical protein n=1 Tax=Sphingobium sp. AS12 TaxID=2849495 RepID=UPI001C315F57|nr:hypothetical protein [Sphingobium sp. AS12]MBV2150205.1 hypothetical protein [Sphingobium sp. AS12]
MSLYINALRKLRERLLDSRRLRPHEVDELNDYLEAEDLAEANRLEWIYECEFCDRVEADGLEDPPKSQAFFNWPGDLESAQREFIFYNDKVIERKEALKEVESKIASVMRKLEESTLSLTQKRKLMDTVSVFGRQRSALDDPNCGPDSIGWAVRLAESHLSGVQWQYEKRLTDDDRRYIEPPRFPIKHLSDFPLLYDHCSYWVYPNEPSPKRKALIEVIDRIISKG